MVVYEKWIYPRSWKQLNGNIKQVMQQGWLSKMVFEKLKLGLKV